MKVIIAGSRGITNYSKVHAAIQNSGMEITEIVSGKAYGVDSLGEHYALSYDIPIKEFPAEWEKYKRPKGKNPAGIIRNQDMVNYAEGLIAIWDGISPGTKDIISKAKKRGLQVYVCVL